MPNQVIVVGGGLGGLSAAHTVLERGGNVVLIDKSAFLGGNSVRATSGINGAPTKTQMDKGIADSVKAFEKDTALSAAGGKEGVPASPLVKVLAGESGIAVDWLMERFGLDLSLVSRLGGHSFPRTHRGKERFPGMTITYALMEKLEEIASKTDRARVITKAEVNELISENGKITGAIYVKNGQKFTEYGPVIVATGGFGADFSDNSLLKQYRPDLAHLPTTNGEHCSGDGIKISTAIGAKTIDMKAVQVHPTGLVHPDEPDTKVKFLAAEALRGVGGILLDNQGERFCDELGRRDYVTGEMWKRNKGPYRLILNGKASKEIEWHCKHYSSRGLMKKYNSGHDLAKDMGISSDKLDATFKEYNKVAQSPPDYFGKKFFNNLPVEINDEFHAAFVTPVIHYCMGGLEIQPDGTCIGENGPIPGLYAAGEVVGGIHGVNRLGGNSLLDCVVFGRVSGATAAAHLVEEMTAQVRSGNFGAAPSAGGKGISASVNQSGVQTQVTVDPVSRNVNLSINWTEEAEKNGFNASSTPSITYNTPSSSSNNSSSAPAPAKEEPKKPVAELTWEEISKHNKKEDLWVVVGGRVLNVTDFLPDHPGGKKAILIWGGKDATEEFDMFHKRDVIDKYLPDGILGEIKSKL